ncbi:MAG: hypothetical protein Q7T97_17055 [Burkholderiaceae bacterium]|nr:hypothetical protein [Burkholderiaceae bacterium]
MWRKTLGQARIRGSRDIRVAEAITKADRLKPPVIACNSCKIELTEIASLDASGLKGIEAAFGAHCVACDQDTWAVRGEIAAVQAFYVALEKAAGAKVQLGIAKPPAPT